MSLIGLTTRYPKTKLGMSQMERWLTVNELSKKLKVGRSTTYKCVHFEYMLHAKLGTSVQFGEKAVEKWLNWMEREGWQPPTRRKCQITYRLLHLTSERTAIWQDRPSSLAL